VEEAPATQEPEPIKEPVKLTKAQRKKLNDKKRKLINQMKGNLEEGEIT